MRVVASLITCRAVERGGSPKVNCLKSELSLRPDFYKSTMTFDLCISNISKHRLQAGNSKVKENCLSLGAFQLMFQLLNCGISCSRSARLIKIIYLLHNFFGHRIAWISIFIPNHRCHLHTVCGPPSHGEPVVRHQRVRCRWAAEHVMEGDVCRSHFKIGFSWCFFVFFTNQRLHTLWKAILPIAVKKSKESRDNWSIL